MFRATLFLLLTSCSHAAISTAPPLSRYSVDAKGVSISGISSGGFMAMQMQVAFSATFAGSGSVAGGPYWCARGSARTAQFECAAKPSRIVITELVKATKAWALAGQIDPVANLNEKPVYVFASLTDTIVDPVSSDKLAEFLQSFGVKVTQVNSVKAAHGFPTENDGGPCETPRTPWINKCGYDTSGEILKTIYGSLKPKMTADESHLLKFTQADFGNEDTPLGPEGWVYVPAACAQGAKCKLHVALHGCLMTPMQIQDQFPRLSGYNDWAETNNIIVLYPQSVRDLHLNPFSCWDMFGFTGKNYVTQAGAQMQALKKMVDRVRGI